MTRARPRRVVRDEVPDVRDGLTRVERVVLVTLQECQAELGGRAVPTALLFGRVSERLDLTQAELVEVVARLGARRLPSDR